MTQLNLQKRAVKITFIILLIIATLFVCVPLPIGITLTSNYFSKIKNGSSLPYNRSLALLVISIIAILILLVFLIRWGILLKKFKKITFPSEERVTVLCEKISIRGLKGLEFAIVKGNGKKFTYVSTSLNELQVFKDKNLGKTVEIKLYANTKLIKTLK